jgi:hypothetical protein
MDHYPLASIRTRYHGPTDHRGSRFTATADDTRDRQRVTVGVNYALSVDANHAAAAQAWLDKFIGYGSMSVPGVRHEYAPGMFVYGRRRAVLTDTALVFAGDHYHTWTDRGAESSRTRHVSALKLAAPTAPEPCDARGAA